LRAEAHLRIGMLMASHTPREKLEEQVFEILPAWVPFYNWPLLVSGGK